jgi:hypothetical protein
MSAVGEARAELEAALAGVPDVPVKRPGENVIPPVTIVGPPALRWEVLALKPTSARFLIYAIVDADERALERLDDLVLLVAEALDGTRGVVTAADPAIYPVGTSELPCYQITVEYPL